MPNTTWVAHTYEKVSINEGDKKELIRFWNEFYTDMFKELKDSDESIGGDTVSSNSEGGEERLNKSQKCKYKDSVFDLLEYEKSNQPLTDAQLFDIQIQVEDMSMKFDERSIFKSLPNIIKILIRKDEECAKDYLKGSKDLNEEDKALISEFGHYTLEALVVHVLGMLYTPLDNSIVRVSSLVERLESTARTQALLLKSRRVKRAENPTGEDQKKAMGDEVSVDTKMAIDSKSGKKKEASCRNQFKKEYIVKYPLGCGLLQFIVERGLITLNSEIDNPVRVQKKKDSYYIPNRLYAICNFDISLLPIKLNLPMVSKPLDWTCACSGRPRSLSDLVGGYLSAPTGEIYDRYRLLSSGDLNNFHIDIGKNDDYHSLCRIMNTLQSQPFRIRSNWLKYIQDNYDLFVKYGFLLKKELASINLRLALERLREFHMQDAVIRQICSYSDLVSTLYKNIQRARYETLILKLASAYDGYTFDLPAFLDFRGRIYRSGILHFHERDLARSLILFANSKPPEESEKEQHLRCAVAAASFHYKGFTSVEEGVEWCVQNCSILSENLLEFAQGAKRPFQFISNMMSLGTNGPWYMVPITHDASASAYQIMSDFLLNVCMARRTNLIPDSNGKIQDIYTYMVDELKEFLLSEMGDTSLSRTVCENVTRKLVKGIYMPIIYGKTLMSTAEYIKENLSHFLTHKECFDVAKVCFQFWREKYQGMDCLIRNIGWAVSAKDSPVFYGVKYFTTVQDYMVLEARNLWVYDRIHKKRRKVTLRVPTSKRDRRKTEIATFVNFIHQKDAFIAMSVVEKLQELKAQVYTVHDNFISTANHSYLIPKVYTSIYRDMGPPLSIVNKFIYTNIISAIEKRDKSEGALKEGHFTNRVIPKKILSYYLNEYIPVNRRLAAT